MTLLNDALAPLTLQIGFWEAPLPRITDIYLRWIRQHYQSIETEGCAAEFTLALQRLAPLSVPARRFLLLATSSSWTAYFDNGANGADARSPIAYLSEQLGCRGVIATCFPHTLQTDTGSAKGSYGAVSFELFGPQKREFLNYQRSVGVAYDGGKWRFDAQGAVQPFEEVEAYLGRPIAKRFTPEMLRRYCEALGIRVFDSDFYCGPGVVIRINDPLPHGCVEVSLEVARQRFLGNNGVRSI